MPQVDWLQLSLWSALDEAATEPEAANLASLWQAVDTAIGDRDPTSQLRIAGQAVAQIAQVFAARSDVAFEQLYARSSADGPVMPADCFDRYVRQSMQIEFEDYLEPLANLPRQPPQRSENQDEQSVAAPVDQQTLIESLESLEILDPQVVYNQVVALAHAEDVAEVGQAITVALGQHQGAVPLLQLQRSLGLPLVEVWLSLLLNGYRLQQRGEFYQPNQIWVVQAEKGQSIVQ
ncbi:MAG: hypothetical protein KME35_06770 [Aphanocapsa sp. GSE-SYN-MK-11-07L]|jgi:hypothetical protein|nr:hypothetical protein [Aphanocapsa sp. GSE-SYN-MK-11-07L]